MRSLGIAITFLLAISLVVGDPRSSRDCFLQCFSKGCLGYCDPVKGCQCSCPPDRLKPESCDLMACDRLCRSMHCSSGSCIVSCVCNGCPHKLH